MKLFLTFLSLITGIEFNQCLDDSSVSASESICMKSESSTIYLPLFMCIDYLKNFKEIEHVIATLKQFNVTVANSSFEKLENEETVVAKTARDNNMVQNEELKTGLQKEVAGSAKKKFSKSFKNVAAIIGKEIKNQVNSIKKSVTGAMNAVRSIITILGTQAQKGILAITRIFYISSQQAVAAAIEKIVIANKIISWIKDKFKIIMQSKIRGVFVILKKQIEAVLKARETSFGTILTQLNKKVIGSVIYVLNLRVDSLTGTNAPSLHQLGHSTIVR